MISTFTEWRIGTLIALVLSTALMAVALRGDGVPGAVLEISSTVFCGGAAVVAYGAPDLVIREFIGALSSGWLALTVWGTVVLGLPFTEAAERRRVAEAVRRDPAFRRTHLGMTAIWGTAFTATAVVLTVIEARAPHSGLVEVVVQLAGNLAPAVCVARYQARRRPETARVGQRAMTDA